MTMMILSTPINEQMVRCLSVCGRIPRDASTNTRAISAREAATAMFLVYCSCPGASAMIRRFPLRSAIDRYATSMVIPCSRSASSPSVRSEKSISPAGIVEPVLRTVFADLIVSCGTLSVSTKSRPIRVLFPSSTLPQVRSRIIERDIETNSLRSRSDSTSHNRSGQSSNRYQVSHAYLRYLDFS